MQQFVWLFLIFDDGSKVTEVLSVELCSGEEIWLFFDISAYCQDGIPMDELQRLHDRYQVALAL